MNNKNLLKSISLRDMDFSNFFYECSAFKEPILITDIFEHFYEMKKWSNDYLVSRVGSKNINVNTSDNGFFTLNPETGEPYFSSTNITIKEYINFIQQNNMESKMYAQQISILKELTELKDDLKILDYIPDKYIEFVNLWMGPGGNTTALHFDGANNFFVQLWGKKKFWLYSPKYFYSLYPNSWISKAPHVSQVNPENIDGVNYPRALEIEKTEVIVSRGNMLFLPAYWWHQVYSINNNISVNIWYKPQLRQKLVFAYFHSCLNSLFNNIENMLTKVKRLFYT